MKKLFSHYLKPYYGKMALGFIIKFIGSLMDLFLPWTLAHMIDYVIPAGNSQQILLWGLFMALCSVLALVFNITANRMAARVSGDAAYAIRADLFTKVMHLSNCRIDEITRPSLISRLTSDVYNVYQMMTRIQRLGVRAPILLLGGTTMTLIMDPFLALILIATLPLLAFVVVFVSKKSIPLYAALQNYTDRFIRLVREDITGIRVIKSLSKENYERRRFDQVNHQVVTQEKKASIVTSITNPAMNLLLNLGLIGVICLGACRVNSGLSEVGSILAFMTYFTIILNALLSVSRMFAIISKATASGARIAAVLENEDEEDITHDTHDTEEDAASSTLKSKCSQTPEQNSHCEKVPSENTSEKNFLKQQFAAYPLIKGKNTPPHIEFQNVSFSYDKKHNNLEHISFSLNKGETLGIIGATGSGKTTVLNLLLRLYDADEGQITIDGKNIYSMHRKELRSRFGTVFQNDTVFEDTIFENIRMGRNITEKDALTAASCACALEFIEEKGGLSEKLDIRGANLSGGQKQRLLITRALAGNPDILLLDDASSALDYKTDAAVRKALRKHYSKTTCIVVAQRISSIKDADRILVLEKGRSIGYGTHDELMKQCPIYREIAASQMGV